MTTTQEVFGGHLQTCTAVSLVICRSTDEIFCMLDGVHNSITVVNVVQVVRTLNSGVCEVAEDKDVIVMQSCDARVMDTECLKHAAQTSIISETG